MKKILTIELNPERIFGLDLLRAFAIMFVMLGHGNELLPSQAKHILDYAVFDGVSIFFVLSGFLIGGILIRILEKHRINRKLLFDFWIRRWFRTLPNYLLIVVVLALLQLIFIGRFPAGLWKFFIFAQNLASPHPHWFFREAWSLSVEEWFYLLIPVMVFAMIRFLRFRQARAIVFAAILLIVAITLFRYYRYLNVPVTTVGQWDILFRKQVFTRLDSLMFGIIGAYAQFYHLQKWLRHPKILMVAGLVLFCGYQFVIPHFFAIGSLYYCVFSFSTVSIATLLLLPFLSSYKSARGKIYVAVTYISLVSYSMYLINLSLVQEWIIGNIQWKALGNLYLIVVLRFALFWTLTMVLSILLYKYFEIPCTNLRDSHKFKGWKKGGSIRLLRSRP
jgi:peptidoglycan/LPS O-acetylase OafA/YrhL